MHKRDGRLRHVGSGSLMRTSVTVMVGAISSLVRISGGGFQRGENSMRHRRISHSVDERWPCSRSKPVCRCYGNNLASYRRQPARLGTAHLPALIYSWQLLIAYKALTHLLTCTGKMARCTRSSAVAEGQRDAMCRLKPGEMLHKSLSNCI